MSGSFLLYFIDALNALMAGMCVFGVCETHGRGHILLASLDWMC